MKKFLTITLLVLLSLGMFISCNSDAAGTVFPNGNEYDIFAITALKDSVVKAYSTKGIQDNYQYSFDGEKWNSFVVGKKTFPGEPAIEEGTSISIKSGQKVYIKTTGIPKALASINLFFEFGANSSVNLSGNIMYLLDPTGKSISLKGIDGAFDHLFSSCSAIVSAKDLLLPATELENSCYAHMFSNCTSMIEGPALPATELKTMCYDQMFDNCKSLEKAPELPATTLADYCYHYMFSDCSSLTTAPELPATTLADYCYGYMFSKCSSLTAAPELPATTMADNCYMSMFEDCTNLNSVSVKFTEWDTGRTQSWLKNVPATGTFTCPTALETPASRTDGNVPAGWTIVKL